MRACEIFRRSPQVVAQWRATKILHPSEQDLRRSVISVFRAGQPSPIRHVASFAVALTLSCLVNGECGAGTRRSEHAVASFPDMLCSSSPHMMRQKNVCCVLEFERYLLWVAISSSMRSLGWCAVFCRKSLLLRFLYEKHDAHAVLWIFLCAISFSSAALAVLCLPLLERCWRDKIKEEKKNNSFLQEMVNKFVTILCVRERSCEGGKYYNVA